VPEDFAVEEIPAYLPCGQGAHLFLQLRKTNRTTPEVVQALARALDIPANDVGTAGLKDKHAVTIQWFSVPASAAGRAAGLQLPGVETLASGLHGNKLKTGHLHGNRFRIRVRAVSPDAGPEIGRRLDVLTRLGVANYFGEQRFGRDGDNEAEGRRVLRGEGRRHDRRTLRFVLSAVQSGLFNDLLARRIREDLFSRVLAGDVMAKESGGMFVCSDPDTDQRRSDALEIHATGPLFGPKMREAQHVPGRMEAEVLSASGLAPEDFRRFKNLTQGARRPLRLRLQETALEVDGDDVVLRFSLPAGAYATVVLSELIQLPRLGEYRMDGEEAEVEANR
jgi:tRNA pseudouridine13 synthase